MSDGYEPGAYGPDGYEPDGYGSDGYDSDGYSGSYDDNDTYEGAGRTERRPRLPRRSAPSQRCRPRAGALSRSPGGAGPG